MEIKIQIDDIDYAALVDVAMPLLKDKLAKPGATTQLLGSILNLPSGMVKAVVNRLPEDKKNQLAATLINGNKEKIIATVEQTAGASGVRVRIRDLQADV